MFYSDFKKYSSHYRNGIKSIKFNTVELTIRSKNLHLLTDKGNGNIELEFSNDGRILLFENFDLPTAVKTYFTFDNKNQLISALSLFSSTNEFHEFTSFEFDSQNRITTEISQKFDPENNLIQVRRKQHAYFGNVETVWLFAGYSEEPESEIEYTCNNEGLIIEEKSLILPPGDKAFCLSYYYYTTENLIMQIFVGATEKYKADIEFYAPFIDKKPSARTIKTAKGTDRFDFEFTLNERGHYTNIIFLKDGNPLSILERIIEYYE